MEKFGTAMGADPEQGGVGRQIRKTGVSLALASVFLQRRREWAVFELRRKHRCEHASHAVYLNNVARGKLRPGSSGVVSWSWASRLRTEACP